MCPERSVTYVSGRSQRVRALPNTPQNLSAPTAPETEAHDEAARDFLMPQIVTKSDIQAWKPR